MKAILLTTREDRVKAVYSNEIITELKDYINDFEETIYTKDMIATNPEKFKETKLIFSTWGMEDFSEEEIKEYFPELKCLFYAAGSVQSFGKPFLNCGVRIFSAWAANAVPVAEYASAQIILANKGFFPTQRILRNNKNYAQGKSLFSCYSGNYKSKIGIIGAGMIGKKVIEMLHSYDVEILVFDPFFSEEAAKAMGVRKTSLEEIFSVCNVISNHLADNEQTKGMFDYSLFSKMLPYSSFVNTGRGAQVVQEDLIRVLKERNDITAYLDVTFPEPLPNESELYDLDNCFLTPHIAGAIGNELWRLGEYMLNEFKRYLNSEPCKYEVTSEMLKTMA